MKLLQRVKEIWKSDIGCAAVLAAAALLICCICLAPLAVPRENTEYKMGDITHVWDEDVSLGHYLPETVLDKGIYTISISYQLANDYEVVVTSINDPEKRIQSTPVILSSGKVQEQFRIVVEENDTIVSTIIREAKAGAGDQSPSFYVHFVYMPRMTVSLYAVYIAGAFLVLLLLILLVRHCRKNRIPGYGYIICALVLLTLFISAPAFPGYVTTRNDTWFHLERIGHLSENLFGGHLQYRLQGGWHNGYGYPVAVFYGEVLLIPAALLYALAVPLWQCYQFTVVFLSALKVGIGYYVFRKLSDSRMAGLFCCVLYAASEWSLNRVHMTSAIGEYSAQIFLPLVFLGYYELITNDEKWKTEFHLIAGFTGLVHTHLITSALCVIMSVLFWILMADVLLRDKRWKTLLSAAVMTIAVNLSFIVPFLDYSIRYELQVEKVQGLMFQRTLFDLFMPDYYGGLGMAVLMALSFALMLMVGGVEAKRKRGILTLAFTVFICVFMSTVYFPWQWLGDHLPFLYNLLASKYQHAFRYLTPALAMICGLLAVLLRGVGEKSDSRKETVNLIVMAAVVTVCFVTGAGLMKYAAVPGDVHGTESSAEAMKAEETELTINVVDLTAEDAKGGGDNLYLRTDMDVAYPLSNLFREATAIGDATVETVERRGTSFTLEVINHSQEETLIAFPVWSYYGYTARGNSGTLPVSDWGNGNIGVMVPGGYEGELKLSFQSPWYWRIADLVSLLSVIRIGFVVWKKHRGSIAISDRTS